VECFLAVMLLTKTIDCSDPLDILTPLGWWALLAFCSHIMIEKLLPVPCALRVAGLVAPHPARTHVATHDRARPPAGMVAGGALTTYSLIIPFLIAFKCILPRQGTPRADADSRMEPMLAPSLEEATAPTVAYGTFGLGDVFRFGSA
jgi:hypothetical protein